MSDEIETDNSKEGRVARLEPYRFEPGNKLSKGRPPGKSLRTLLKALLDYEIDVDDPLTREKCKMTAGQAVALKLVERALKGNLKAIEIILDRVDGKVADMIQLGNIDDKPLEINNNVIDYSKISTEELLTFKTILSKLKPKE